MSEQKIFATTMRKPQLIAGPRSRPAQLAAGLVTLAALTVGAAAQPSTRPSTRPNTQPARQSSDLVIQITADMLPASGPELQRIQQVPERMLALRSAGRLVGAWFGTRPSGFGPNEGMVSQIQLDAQGQGSLRVSTPTQLEAFNIRRGPQCRVLDRSPSGQDAQGTQVAWLRLSLSAQGMLNPEPLEASEQGRRGDRSWRPKSVIYADGPLVKRYDVECQMNVLGHQRWIKTEEANFTLNLGWNALSSEVVYRADQRVTVTRAQHLGSVGARLPLTIRPGPSGHVPDVGTELIRPR